MKTPKQYEYDLAALREALNTAAQAGQKKAVAEQAAHLEGQLALDLRSLQAQYRARAVSHISTAAKQAGKDKAAADRRLADEETERLEPYRKLLEAVRSLLKEVA
jgi:hypothetical protein